MPTAARSSHPKTDRSRVKRYLRPGAQRADQLQAPLRQKHAAAFAAAPRRQQVARLAKRLLLLRGLGPKPRWLGALLANPVSRP